MTESKPEVTAPDVNEIAATTHGAVRQLRLDRPAKRNALTMPMFDALARALIDAEADPAVRAVLLSGAGKAFCAGHDLEAFAAWPQAPDDPVPRFLHALAALRKPFVVAVQGSAAGIGVTLLLHADWVLAAPGAALRLPFLDIGIVPEAASTLLLAQAVGAQRAKQLLLGGAPFSSEDAHRWGLVTELVDEAGLLDAAQQRAEALAARDPLAVRAVKGWLRPGDDEMRRRIDEEIAAINAAIARRGR